MQKTRHLFLFFMTIGVYLLHGQTYSSSPSLGTYTACVSGGSIYGGCAASGSNYWTSNVVKAQVVSLNSTDVTIRIAKCAGGTFSVSGSGHCKMGSQNVCGTQFTNGWANYNAGASYVDMTFAHGVSPGSSVTITPTISSNNTNGDKYYAEDIVISATAIPDVEAYDFAISPGSASPNGTVFTQCRVRNNSSATAPASTLGYYLTTTYGMSNPVYYLGSVSVPSITGNSNSAWFNQNLTIPNNASPGNYYLTANADDGYAIVESNENNNPISIPFTVLANTPPQLIFSACINLTSGSSITQGNTLSGNFELQNYGSQQNWSGYVIAYLYDVSSGTNVLTLLNNYYSINGGSYQTCYINSILNIPVGNYRIYVAYDNAPNGGTDFVYNAFGCSPSTSNTSTGTTTHYENVSVTAPVTCGGCTAWTNPPAVGTDPCTSTAYLCQQGYIQNSQDGTYNHNTAIQRNQLAKIIYLGLFGSSNPTSISDNFPTPFNDMQSLNANNTYWYNAAKNLCYLEFGDGVSPFDRDFFNFNPANPIKRKYALKAFMEAFNIAPDWSGSSPYSDVTINNDMFGYINKANQLGIMGGNTINCASGTCFHPDDNMTREQAFVVLYRILTYANITRPTLAQLQNPNNYFIPGNYTLSNMSKVPGIDQANFNHYEKTSFSIPSRGLPLEFTHSYNSFMTELPTSFFEAADGTLNNQRFNPLGIGWTHNYNNYIQKVAGYTFGSSVIPEKWYIFWGDGRIHVYIPSISQYETQGVYDDLTVVNSNEVLITTKDQITFRFLSTYNADLFFPSYIKDRNNNQLTYYYQQPGGAGTPIRISSVKDLVNNRQISFFYQTINGHEYLQSVSETGLNRSISFGITNDNLSSFTDAKGQNTYYSYNASGTNTSHLLTQIQLPKGNIIENTYEQRKLTATRTLNQSGTITSASQVDWQNQYTNNQGQSGSTITDAQGLITNYSHNTEGNPTNISSPTTTISGISYGTGNSINLPQSMTINNQVLTTSYDNKGNMLSISRNGITNTFTYTAMNDIQTHTDGNGNQTIYNYTSGNLTGITRPATGGSVSIQRNGYGQPTQITNPSGITTTLGYNNSYGNLTDITFPLGISTSASYDGASRVVTKTDANGHTTAYQYDNNDNVTQETDANSGITTMGYDPNDNLTNITNAKGETTTLTYSYAEDWLMSEVFGGNSKSYTYFPDGSLQTHTKGTGTFTYTYDPQGRIASDGQTSYTYDNRSNIATITNVNGTLNLYYDINDRLDHYTDYFGNTVYYTYDNNDNVLSIVYPGNKTVTYNYDANNRMNWVKDWNNHQINYTWLTDDRIDRVDYPNGTYCQYYYDAAGRMTGLSNKKTAGNVIISEYTFSLDNAGNHTTENINDPATSSALGALANGTINYPNMPNNRIVSAGATSFQHDAAGNIIQEGADAYSFDLNDNLLSATGSSPAIYTYDGSQNRRSRTANGIQVRYILDILGMGNVLMETDANNTPTAYYVYGATGLVSRIRPNNTTHYYHYDSRGSTAAMTDAAANVTHSYAYTSFGEVIATNEADFNPYRYNGQYGVQYDAPNRTFMRARYANPTTGRFISEDPIWATNLYPYAGNNPINFIDPKGQISLPSVNSLLELVKLAEQNTWVAKHISNYLVTKRFIINSRNAKVFYKLLKQEVRLRLIDIKINKFNIDQLTHLKALKVTSSLIKISMRNMLQGIFVLPFSMEEYEYFLKGGA